MNQGTQGAKRQRFKKFNLTMFVSDLIKHFKGTTQDDAIDDLTSHVKQCIVNGDFGPLEAVCDYAASNTYNTIMKKQETERKRREAEEPRQEPEPQVLSIRNGEPLDQAALNKSMTTIAFIVLKTMTLPTGRTLYDSTREEIIEYMGQLTDLIAKLKPGQTPRQAGITSFIMS